MIDEALLQKLSLLARVAVPQSDIQNRLGDFMSILGFIAEIEKVVIPDYFQPVHTVVNHARADIVRPATPETVAGIVGNFPANVLGQLQVPQVLKK